MLNEDVKQRLHQGTVIPAHPLALTSNRKLDIAGQRALTRYYIEAGAGGVAVGVHTTQFEIRDPQFNLYEKVLRLAIEEMKRKNVPRSFIKIAGICGPVDQALKEAEFAKGIGYDLGLLSMGGLRELSEAKLLERTRKVAEVIPIIGFYLQPAVGGRKLSYKFWKSLADIPNVHAIKIAPFNRYLTHDVIRAVCNSDRNKEIAIYTGNDDNIVNDLLTTFRVDVNGEKVEKKIVGGLLGHWSVWTKQVVKLFEVICMQRDSNQVSSELLTIGQEITDANAAFFDAANDFKGSIAGVNEVLRRQGLLQGNWCLLDKEMLSPKQSEEIDRVYQAYPHLNDDAFVKDNIDKWLS
ncbi:dihydrodipicolinate synthase family protein [Virgibacillus halodenitrificans]|uniref:dihydrodipicolinate synthase family protein n=1 Tax=Virgibacillus halodenitrificans TaxID=1482 RepID=UPI0024BF9C43|nr:dihydrodipicolinate synthase family protein [Virgibacillus halodenitrificans]WHX26240.1 dihydrodipicolinate synthase family protein [Virgibacillus halodenitrificans]